MVSIPTFRNNDIGNYIPYIVIFLILVFIWYKIKQGATAVVETITGTTSTPASKQEPKTATENFQTRQTLFDTIKAEWKATSSQYKDKGVYSGAAESLLSIMQYSQLPFSGKFQKVMDVLKPFKAHELKQVYAYFGIRSNFNFGVKQLEGDLFQWFAYEFDGEDLRKLKSWFRSTNLWS